MLALHLSQLLLVQLIQSSYLLSAGGQSPFQIGYGGLTARLDLTKLILKVLQLILQSGIFHLNLGPAILQQRNLVILLKDAFLAV